MEQFFVKYQPAYSKLTGCHGSAILLLRLMFWQEVMKGKEFAKQSIDLQEECDLSGDCIRRYLNKMAEQGLIIFRKKKYNNAPTYHFTIQNSLILNKIRILQNTNLAKSENRNLPISENTSFKTGTLQETMETGKTPISITEEDNKKKTEEKPIAETSSAVAKVLKTEFMQKAAEQAIQRNEPAKTKAKKPKEPSDELTSEIHKYTCQAHDYFKQWYEDKYQTSLVTWDKDFVNIKKTFRKLIDGSANLEEKKRLTPERCFLGVKYIIENFDKLHISKQNKLSLNYIATNWNELIPSIKNFQAPVQKRNFNEPVPFVPAIKEKIDYYNTMPLPVGLSDEVFRELGEAVYREKVMDEEVDPKQISGSQFTEMLYKQIRNLPYQEIQKILENYGIV